jgi:hypothetical protein
MILTPYIVRESFCLYSRSDYLYSVKNNHENLTNHTQAVYRYVVRDLVVPVKLICEKVYSRWGSNPRPWVY